jgi:hypothetical protein
MHMVAHTPNRTHTKMHAQGNEMEYRMFCSLNKIQEAWKMEEGVVRESLGKEMGRVEERRQDRSD